MLSLVKSNLKQLLPGRCNSRYLSAQFAMFTKVGWFTNSDDADTHIEPSIIGFLIKSAVSPLWSMKTFILKVFKIYDRTDVLFTFGLTVCSLKQHIELFCLQWKQRPLLPRVLIKGH